jgi:ATP-binding cassette subfamily F protein 3
MLGLSESSKPRNGIRKLDSAMQMSTLTSDADNIDTTSIWMRSAKDTASQVDSKKLQKAEAKLQQKQDRRLADGLRPSTGTNALMSHECQASAAQVISKKDNKATGQGKITDIKIENFDVAFGEKLVFHVGMVGCSIR